MHVCSVLSYRSRLTTKDYWLAGLTNNKVTFTVNDEECRLSCLHAIKNNNKGKTKFIYFFTFRAISIIIQFHTEFCHFCFDRNLHANPTYFALHAPPSKVIQYNFLTSFKNDNWTFNLWPRKEWHRRRT